MKKNLLILFWLLAIINTANAQFSPYFSLSRFAIQNFYLSESKLKVNNINPTSFKFEFEIIRGATGANWQSGDCIATVIYTESQEAISEVKSSNNNNVGYESHPSTIELSTPKSVTSADYSYESATFYSDKAISAKIPGNKNLSTGKVLLRYKYYDGFTQQYVTRYSSTKYSLILDPTTIPAGPPPPVFTVPVVNSVPLYEYYSAITGVHFYSTTWTGTNYSTILGYVFNSQVVGTVPLYIYYSAVSGKYHYSTDLANSFGNYNYSGIACYVYSSQVTKTRPVFQHFNTTNNDHYFFDGPATFEGYRFEDIKFYILQNPQATTYPLPEEDTMELYQYYSSAGDHFYTTLKKDRPGFTYEKVLGYVHTLQKPGTVPLYRYSSSMASSKDHYYTLNQQNYVGYTYEGIVGYVYLDGNYPDTKPVYSYYASINGDHYYNTIDGNYNGYANEGIKFYMLQYNH